MALNSPPRFLHAQQQQQQNSSTISPHLPHYWTAQSNANSHQVLIVNDPIYGGVLFPIEVEPILRTNAFQRLWNIRQLGLSQFVFAAAKHTRAEHCLGVAYLALTAVRQVAVSQAAESFVPPHAEVIAALAGLFHDIGHGPFSHILDKILVNECKRRKQISARNRDSSSVAESEESLEWFSDNLAEHECRSLVFCRSTLRMFPDLFSEGDIEWVCWMIDPSSAPRPSSWKPEYHWMSHIVSNTVHGIDVDKLDYLARDIFYLCARPPSITDWSANTAVALVRDARVVWIEDPESGIRQTTWLYAKKDATTLIGLPALRQHMHFVYYQSCQVILLDATLHKYFSTLFENEILTVTDMLNPKIFMLLNDTNLNEQIMQEFVMGKHVESSVLATIRNLWNSVVSNVPVFSYGACIVYPPMEGSDSGLSNSRDDWILSLVATAKAVMPQNAGEPMVIDSKMAGGFHDFRRVADHLKVHDDALETSKSIYCSLRDALKTQFEKDAIPYGPLGKASRACHVLRPV